MSLNDFIFKEILGKGSFGSVHKVQRKSDKKIYALKQIKISQLKEKDKKNSLNEIRILASLSHKNIIGYKESFFDENSKTLNIIMEYADDGDISIKIKNNIKKSLLFSEKTIWNWIIQLLEGINYLHENGIMHRDLKSANLFLLKNGILKIGDLNVSIISKNGLAYTQTGTPYYAPPEIWKDHPYNFKCDIWSAGCIIYEICTLHPPFRGTNFKELFNNIIKGIYNPINKMYSDDLRNLLKMMIVVNPDKRFDIKMILNSEIIKKKMKEMNFCEDDLCENNKALLMGTIKIPRNMMEINNNLPKRYLEKQKREEEMMKNDEFETAKHTFYQTLMKNIKENNEKNENQNIIEQNNNNNNNNNNDNKNINNDISSDNNSYQKNNNPNNHNQNNKNYHIMNNNNNYNYNLYNDLNKKEDDIFTQYYNKIKHNIEENKNKKYNILLDNEIKNDIENKNNLDKNISNNPINQMEKNNEKMKNENNIFSNIKQQEKNLYPVNKLPSNNLFNYRPQSEASRLNQIRNNNYNYFHYQNNNNNNNDNNKVLVNRNYMNEYIQKEREINEKKRELKEMNKNLKLLEINSKKLENNYIFRRPPSANYNHFNKQQNLPIFQYKKNDDYKNRKITYGKIEYQKKGNEIQYHNIPIQLKYNNYNNNYNKYNFNNNNNNQIHNNPKYNYNINFLNNNYKPKYSIENINFNNNNNNIGNKNSRGGPRVFLWNELK